MAKRRTLSLTDVEIQALQTLRDKGQPAYLSERAAALLKVHEGMSAHKVARTGLLKKRHPDTVYAWLRRYEAEGIIGLYHKPVRFGSPLLVNNKQRVTVFLALQKKPDPNRAEVGNPLLPRKPMRTPRQNF